MKKYEDLLKFLIERGILKTDSIIDAFYDVDRSDFVLEKYADETYADHPLPIGHSQTISQPTTVAFMMELLQPTADDKILDVGSGSGWTTALLARIVGEGGYVWGVEIIPELVEFGGNNLAKYSFRNAEILQASERLGLQNKTPFDKILVSASSGRKPQELIDQLAVGGRIVIPVGNSIWKIDKDANGELTEHEYPGFVFVPLRG